MKRYFFLGIFLFLSNNLFASCINAPIAVFCDVFSFTDAGNCQAQEGCIYSSNEICFGTPRQCSSYDEPLACSSQAGCAWDFSAPTPTPPQEDPLAVKPVIAIDGQELAFSVAKNERTTTYRTRINLDDYSFLNFRWVSPKNREVPVEVEYRYQDQTEWSKFKTYKGSDSSKILCLSSVRLNSTHPCAVMPAHYSNKIFFRFRSFVEIEIPLVPYVLYGDYYYIQGFEFYYSS